MQTKIIDNFTGALTRRDTGELNSGLAKYDTSFGYDPITKPGDLTWLEQPTSILSLSGTDGPIVAMKQRTEGANNYVYGIANNRNLYRIQVNEATSKIANYDSPSVVGALKESQTFDQSADMTFFGSTEKIFVSSESAIQKINFNGSGSASIATAANWAGGVPRPMAQFLGKIYFGNGNNIGEIDSTELMTTTTKLAPGFPSGTYVRDLDVTPDGNYLQITASRNIGGIPITGTTNDTTSSSGVDSYKFFWNGTDEGYTAFEKYDGLNLVANKAFSDRNFTFGYDPAGAGVFSGAEKVLYLPKSFAPHPGAVYSIGNIVGLAAPEYEESTARFKTGIFNYGRYDNEISQGLFRLLRQGAVVKNDVVSIPACLNVSNLLYFFPFYNYTSNIGGVAKIYYSTVEAVSSGGFSVAQKLWRFPTIPTGLSSVLGGVWESQNEIFSKKVKPTEIRFYTEPLVADNSFKIDLVNSKSSILTSKTFTAGTPPVSIGDDRVWWNPQIAPGYSWGTRITNLGSMNWVGVKMELDFVEAGK